jgi:hypothetical protein
VIALQAIFSDRGRCAATSSRHLSRSCKPAAPQRHAEIKCGFPSAFIRCQFVQDVTPRSNLEPALTAITSACLGPESRTRNKRRTNIHETQPAPARPRARATPRCTRRQRMSACTAWRDSAASSARLSSTTWCTRRQRTSTFAAWRGSAASTASPSSTTWCTRRQRTS